MTPQGSVCPRGQLEYLRHHDYGRGPAIVAMVRGFLTLAILHGRGEQKRGELHLIAIVF